MNYCVLNGIKSNTVKGLLIQSLPAITKPLMRTQIEQIDGRDGDVVTELGYSAYDKQMKIGLYGDFEINDVIKFFSSEGTVVFSNEVDKYYNYKIIAQIDFERLIKYRTATVTFHVQPFKYSAVDESITEDTTEITSISVFSRGNTTAKPRITLYGSGIVNISLNGKAIFVVDIDDEFITIDATEMNAFQGDVLKNRFVQGDYDDLSFHFGTNVLSWSGNVTQITVENFSRWI